MRNPLMKLKMTPLVIALTLLIPTPLGGCTLDSEVFGSYASRQSSGEGVSSLALSSVSSEPERSASEADTSKTEQISGTGASSQTSEANTESSSVSQPEQSIPDKKPGGSGKKNSAFERFGLKAERDATALILYDPLSGRLAYSELLDQVSLDGVDGDSYSLLLVPVYNKSRISVISCAVLPDGTLEELEVLHDVAQTPDAYALYLQVPEPEPGDALKITVESAGLLSEYLLTEGKSSGADYLLDGESEIRAVNFREDADIESFSEGDAIQRSMQFLFDQLEAREIQYKWEVLPSRLGIKLSLHGGDLDEPAELYLDCNNLDIGDDCCYYMIRVSTQTLDENGNVKHMEVRNRYLVSYPDIRVIPMLNTDGTLNSEYADIIS